MTNWTRVTFAKLPTFFSNETDIFQCCSHKHQQSLSDMQFLPSSSVFSICTMRYCGPSYLPLREVEHCDEAKHLVRVIVITVFWHLSLLNEHQRNASVDTLFFTTQLNARRAHLDDAADVILLDDDFRHL